MSYFYNIPRNITMRYHKFATVFLFCLGLYKSTAFLRIGAIWKRASRNNNHVISSLNAEPNRENKHYHYSKKYYEDALQRLRSNNFTSPYDRLMSGRMNFDNQNNSIYSDDEPGITIILKGEFLQQLSDMYNNGDNDEEHGESSDQEDADIFNPFMELPRKSEKHNPHRRENPYLRAFRKDLQDIQDNDSSKLKSKNFEVIKKYGTKFADVGGYANIKTELKQSVDILRNYAKYAKYNVRIPKGLILEGPPGNGKTLLAKSLAGEAGCGFIAVSGADFQEKYVGVGSSRIREMFELAKKNEPCIIFIDEIDAVGRHRSGDGESSSSERDNTLNALLVELDGFKNNTGVFVVGATNRIDLLDPALVRPGRIDKKIFIGLPDKKTRKEVIQIHIRGKPHDESVILEDLVEITDGLSCAQIENLLNEAMLHALRQDSVQTQQMSDTKNETDALIEFTYSDVDIILNKILAGWQSSEQEFSQDMINRIAVHEMGHAILGYLSKHHSKLVKVVLNLSSPKTPGYTIFEPSATGIHLKEALFERIVILLGGRIAEEVLYNVSITTGAINDFEEAYKLAERMIMQYGMGEKVIYPNTSEKYKEIIDNEVIELINYAYLLGRIVLENCKQIIIDSSEFLVKEKKMVPRQLTTIFEESSQDVLILRDIFSG